MSLRCITIAMIALFAAAHASRLLAAATTQPFPAPGGYQLMPDYSAANPVLLLDDDDDDAKPKAAAAPGSDQQSSRYFLGLLDHRSSYGKDFFPDPFIGPEFDAEQQVELDYLHSEKRGLRDDEVDAGFQWNPVGQLTVAGEFGWESEHQDGAGGAGAESEGRSGFESVDLAAYHPVYQFVSNDGLFDYSAVVRLDLGIPTRTPVSGGDAQLTPYLGQLLRIGNHVSIEAWTGSQFTIAPHQITQFIYGANLGYEISHDQLPVPLTEKVTPVLELDGQTPFSGNGGDALFAVAGADITFKSIGEVQPAVDVGCLLPMDEGARDQLNWGVVVQFLFEF
jgi:hypothetical protein